MSRRCVVLVFAKAPVAGLAKTRLIPVLGAEGAARLARCMLEETIATAVRADVGPVILCCTPDCNHAAFTDLMTRHGILLVNQGQGDLGARMDRAITAGLQAHHGAIVIGTDCPALGVDQLRQAAQVLETGPVVFVPAADGGYVLAGLDRPMPELFVAVDWSTEKVMAQTRERLARMDVMAIELPTLHDIDLPIDLIHVPREWLT